MATEFPNTQAIPEGSSRRYSATLTDVDGVTLTPGQVSSIRFSLRDARSNAVVNGRYRQEVRNANGGTLNSAGLFALVLNPQDTVAIGTSHFQLRRATFEVTYVSGVENHEVTFYVENLKDIPGAAEAVAGEFVRLAEEAPSTTLVP